MVGDRAAPRSRIGAGASLVSDRTFVICPEIEAGTGGLADYTLRVLEHWPAGSAVQLIVPKTGAAGISVSWPLQEIDRKADALLEALPARNGKVLLQYSAYGFDRIGYPRWLLRALVEWKKRSGGFLVVMFHEIWAFWPLLNKSYLVQQLHRRDLRALLEQTDAALTSTASQAQHLRVLAPSARVQVLPVGSNVRPIRLPRKQHGVRGAVLFGLAQTRLRTLAAMAGPLRSLARAGAISKIITVGAGASATEVKHERELLQGLAFSGGFDQRGSLAESEVSAIMSDADFGISAQDELSITKSGTLMAYAAHEMNIISTHGGPAKPEPLCWFTSPEELLNNLRPNELLTRAQRLRAWQERTASWTVIAEQFARALQLPDALS